MNNNIILYTIKDGKNQIKVGMNYCVLITNTPAFGEMEFRISMLDVQRIKGFKWRAVEVSPGRFYAHNNKAGYLHRFIMSPQDEMVVDHISHNTLDNRRTNLRNCTSSENNANKTNTKFIVAGITPKANGRYTVRIRKGQSYYFSGTFGSLDEAIKARLMAEIKLGFLAHSHLYRALLTREETNEACNEFFVNLELGQIIESVHADKIRNMIIEEVA